MDIYKYLESNGGSERFDFWAEKEGKDVPDVDAAYAFGQALRDRHPDLNITIGSGVVRVSLPAKVLT